MLDIPILGIVPEDREVRVSSAEGSPVIIRSPRSPSGEVFRKLAWEIFAERGDIDYRSLAEESVSEIKKKTQEMDINYQILLRIEREGKIERL